MKRQEKRPISLLPWGFALLLAVLLGLDAVIHRHAYFSWEESFGFHAVFGLVAAILLVLAAKYLLNPLVKRDEEYYDS